MSEEEIRRYLSRQSVEPKAAVKPRARVAMPPKPPPARAGFKDFSATHVFCARCRKATPVRERLLLVLPGGDLYDYQCTVCGTSVGTRKAGK